MLRWVWAMALGLAPAMCLGQASAEDLLRQAMSAYRDGRVDEAFARANQAIDVAPEDPSGYYIRGTVHESKQEYDRALKDYNQVVEFSPDLALAYSRRGGLQFKRGDFDASIADFDREIELDPAAERNHWRRGISYYYAGRYEDGWQQFELSHNTVNRNDYENGIFHFLCFARAKGVEQARESMLDIDGDTRVPMKEIYDLYRGEGSVEAVINAAKLKDHLFYAHLYVGLYQDLVGEAAEALSHITRAVEDYPISHYMWDVARIHAKRLERSDRTVTFHRAPKPLPAGAVTHDWTTFLGPTRNGISTETKLLKEFPESGPPLVWEMKKGTGYSSPAIAGDRLVFIHRVGDMERVECRHPETGGLHWRIEYPTDFSDRYGYNNGPRASPVIDEDRVYTYGAQAKLQCRKLQTGELIWKRDLAAELRIPQGFFGATGTPVIDGDLLIANAGASGGPTVAAFDKRTGRTVWGAGEEWGASYASPVSAVVHGKPRTFVFAGGESRPPTGGLIALDPRTGRIDFTFPWRSRSHESVNASCPTIIGNQVFLSASYKTGAVLLDILPDGGRKVAWTNPTFDLHFNTAVHRDGYLYGFPGRNEQDAALACVDLRTGEEMWRTELEWTETIELQGKRREIREGTFRGSLLWADGRFLALGEHGHLLWLDLNPEGCRVLSRASLFKARETWAAPVLSRGLLYVTQNSRSYLDGSPPRLLCYDLRAASDAVR